MKPKRLIVGLMNAKMNKAIEELIPPMSVYCFLLINRYESTIQPNMNLSAQGIITMLAAMVVIAADMLF